MSKTETMKSLPTSVEIRQATEQIKSSAETLTKQLEPMATAMAALAEETRTVLLETQKTAMDQAKAWSDHQAKAADSIHNRWGESVKQINQAKNDLSLQISEVRRVTEDLTNATRSVTWRLWGAMTLGITITLIVLLGGLWHLIPGDLHTDQKSQTIWIRIK